MFGVVLSCVRSRRFGALAREASRSGDDSAVSGVCEHASVVLQDGLTIADNIPAAGPVVFALPGLVETAKKVAEAGHLGKEDVTRIEGLDGQARTSGVPVLVRLGDTETFAVRDENNRSIPGGWAHVQTTDIARPAGSGPQQSALRRSTENDALQCKVNSRWRGYAFVERNPDSKC